MTETKIIVEGFVNESGERRRINRVFADQISDVLYPFGGCLLDEWTISVVLKTRKDIDELIKVLETNRHCFS